MTCQKKSQLRVNHHRDDHQGHLIKAAGPLKNAGEADAAELSDLVGAIISEGASLPIGRRATLCACTWAKRANNRDVKLNDQAMKELEYVVEGLI